MMKTRMLETTMLAAMILATGCSGQPGSADDQGTEAALNASSSTDLAGTYKGPKVKLETNDGRTINGTIVLMVKDSNGETDANDNTLYCKNDQLHTYRSFRISVRLNDGKEYLIEEYFAENPEHDAMQLFQSQSFTCVDTEHYLHVGSNGDLTMEKAMTDANGDGDLYTHFGNIKGGLPAGMVFKK